MPDAPRSPVLGGFLKPALRAAVGILAVGWTASALAMLLSGGTDLRIPARMWLVAHGSGIVVGEARMGVVPLGATLVVIALTGVVAHRVARAEITDLGGFAGVVGMTTGIAAAILAAVVSTDDVVVSIPRATVGGLLVGGIGAALGAGWRHRSQLVVSDDVGLVIRGASRALAVVLGTSLALVVLMLAVHGRRAADMWGLLDPSVGGAVVIALACILSLPTLVLWAASVLIGPGFSLGTDTSVDLTGSYLGAIPGFPTLAAVPDPGAFGPWILILGLVPPLAGVWAGSISPHARIGAMSGAAAGLVLGGLIAISGGGVGPGRLVDAGPPPVTPAVLAVVILAAAGALGSLLAHYRGRRATRKPSESDRLGLGRWLQPPSSD